MCLKNAVLVSIFSDFCTKPKVLVSKLDKEKSKVFYFDSKKRLHFFKCIFFVDDKRWERSKRKSRNLCGFKLRFNILKFRFKVYFSKETLTITSGSSTAPFACAGPFFNLSTSSMPSVTSPNTVY